MSREYPLHRFAVGLLLLHAVGCATVPKPPPPSSLIFANGRPQPCQLEVDGSYLRRVEPARRVLIRNLPNRDYLLGVACGEERAQSRLSPGADGQPLQFELGDGEARDHTAALVAHNPTPMNLELYLGTSWLGRLFAHSQSLFAELPAGPAKLRMVEMATGGEWEAEVELASQLPTSVTVAPPPSALAVTNDSPETVDLTLLERRARLAAGELARFEELPFGATVLTVRFAQSGRLLELPVALPAGGLEEVKLSARTGSLAVVNRLAESATLTVGGRQVATVAAGAQETIDGLAAVPTWVEATTAAGRLLRQEFVLVPDALLTWVLGGGNSQLMVRNFVGESVTVNLDGQELKRLAPLEAARVPLSAGFHQLEALNVGGYLEARSVEIGEGQVRELVLGPQGGRLMLVNRSDRPLRFHRNGKPLGELPPGLSVEHGGLPLGRSLIEALDGGLTVVASQQLEIQGQGKPLATMTVTTGNRSARIRNATGEPVKVTPEIPCRPQVIPDGEEGVATVPAARTVVKLRGVTTGNRYDRWLEAGGEEETTVVLEPVTGGIVIENATSWTIEVAIDGGQRERLEAGGMVVRDRLSPGPHQLHAWHDDRPLEELTCRLVAGSWFAWKLRPRTASLRVLNRSGEGMALALAGSAFGTVPAGGQTTLTGLAVGRVEVAATGETSGRRFAFAFTAREDGTEEWAIEKGSSSLRLVGLDGQAAELFVDGELVLPIPAGAESISVPLLPGTRLVKVQFEGDLAHLATLQAQPNLETVLDVGPTAPTVKVRNRTGLSLKLTVDGLTGGEIEPDNEFVVLFSRPGRHTIVATDSEGTRQWRLQDTMLHEGGEFGWTLTE